MSTTPHAELLTEDEIRKALNTVIWDKSDLIDVARAIERALLARLGEQQPVATVYTMEALVPGGEAKCHASFLKSVPAGTKLYAHPPAAQPVAQGEREAQLMDALRDTLDFVERHSNRWDGVNGKHPAEVVENARALLAARSAAQGAAQVPAGWRLVPVEPNDAMLDATTTCHKGRLYPQDSVHGPRAMRRREYVAMLSAAPSPAGERTSTEGDA